MKNIKNKEIEIKLIFDDKEDIIKSIPDIIFKKSLKIRDRYYGREYLDMKNNHQIIRIREKINLFSELTYKGKTKNYNNIWERTEINVPIEDAEKMNKILLLLGFKKIREFFSEREYWSMGDNIEIVFSKFKKPKFLEFMEIEAKSHKGINSLLKLLGNKTKEAGEEIFNIFDK